MSIESSKYFATSSEISAIFVVVIHKKIIYFYREIGGEVSTDGDFLTFEGNQYRRGFLYKWFPLNIIVGSFD